VSDDEERHVASEIELSHPDWMVMWGCYSRQFWAFPLFLVPQGTMVSASRRDKLLAEMRSVQAEFTRRRRVPRLHPVRAGRSVAPPSSVGGPRAVGQCAPETAFSPAPWSLETGPSLEPRLPMRVPANGQPRPSASTYAPMDPSALIVMIPRWAGDQDGPLVSSGYGKSGSAASLVIRVTQGEG
jgi:hypothetical protein